MPATRGIASPEGSGGGAITLTAHNCRRGQIILILSLPRNARVLETENRPHHVRRVAPCVGGIVFRVSPVSLLLTFFAEFNPIRCQEWRRRRPDSLADSAPAPSSLSQDKLINQCEATSELEAELDRIREARDMRTPGEEGRQR